MGNDIIPTPTPAAAVTPPAPDIQDTSAPPLMPTQTNPQPPPPVPPPSGPAQAPASAGTSSPAPGGVLGNIALGALGGANSALNNNPPVASSNHRGIISAIGNGLKTIAKNTPWGLQIQNIHQEQQARQQALAAKKQAAQIAQQKAQQDAVKATDEHTESAIRATGMTTDNLHKMHEYEHLESMYADQEAGARAVSMGQLRTEMDGEAEEWENLVAAGVPIDALHGPGFDGMTSDMAQQAGSGATVGITNGKPRKETTMGWVNKAALQNTPLPKDTPVISDYSLDQKTGVITPIRTTLAAGHNNAWDSLITYGAASKKFHQLQDIWATSQKNKEAEDTSKKTQAETVKDLAEANNQNKQAELLGGDVINHTAQQLVDANEDPSQLTKRSKNYDAQVAAADDYSLRNYGVHWSPAQATLDYRYASLTQTQNTLKYLNSLTGKDGRGGNLKVLVDASNKINRTDFPAVNNYEAWAKLQAGNPAMAAYYAQVTEVADQVAKILQGGGTGSGTSDAKLKQASDLFDKGFSKQSIQAVAEALHPLLANRQKEMIGNNRYLIKQYPEAMAPNGTASIATGSDGKQYYLDAQGKPISVVGYGVR